MNDHTLYLKSYYNDDEGEGLHIVACDYIRVLETDNAIHVDGHKNDSIPAFRASIFFEVCGQAPKPPQGIEKDCTKIIVQNASGKTVHCFAKQ